MAPDSGMAKAMGVLRDGLEQRVYSGAVFAAAVDGNVVAMEGIGRESFDDSSASVTPNTIFDVASLTKPVATATSILQLVERGRLHLLQSVQKLFADRFGPLPHLRDVEVRHLLTHTSGLPPIPTGPAGPDADATIHSAIMSSLSRTPGTGYTYSDTGYILLGEIVRMVTVEGLDQWALREIYEPLGLCNTKFKPQQAGVAATDIQVELGLVHDPRARDMGGVAGHAGLFSTAPDLLRYAEAIRKGGNPILSSATVARMAQSQIPASVGGQSYGWFCCSNGYLPSGDLFSDAAFGHSGFTGCLLLIDPQFGVSLVLLTNRVLNTEEDGTRFLTLRRMWTNCMAAALT